MPGKINPSLETHPLRVTMMMSTKKTKVVWKASEYSILRPIQKIFPNGVESHKFTLRSCGDADEASRQFLALVALESKRKKNKAKAAGDFIEKFKKSVHVEEQALKKHMEEFETASYAHFQSSTPTQ
jgi:hypothetical protein